MAGIKPRIMVIIMKKFLLGLSILLASITANADEWTEVSSSNSADFYLSAQRIKNKGSIYNTGPETVEIWVKAIDTKTFPPKYKAGTYTMTRYEFTCPAETYNAYEYVRYTKNGEVIERDNSPINNLRVMPESVIEQVFFIACEVVKPRQS